MEELAQIRSVVFVFPVFFAVEGFPAVINRKAHKERIDADRAQHRQNQEREG